MRYYDMVRNAPKKSENTMWKSVEHVSDMICELEEVVPDMVREFLIEEWEMMYGAHYNEQMAREVVGEMWHNDEDGKRVEGEVMSVDECASIVPRDKWDTLLWDAYVGVNGFAHDFAKCGMNKDSLIEMARVFWMEDEDFEKRDEKVWWYFSRKD